ncbi:PepSY domain-containing protein [Lysinibacillus fusiformis]|uniref:PepSY domain-containing protein n=1 Tax=Lysinibacillus fusiformis TaxID=28031 RepID=UPI00215A54EB|nr:PepSY domain-containing protein [Lysinibacillus fusiformis]MCR8854507.1 PepSY domain-containing protein [Lysinibacillus fusiformis]WKT76487.1 PepSY domain-containing protein [Lysinibacillus fusiformis]
MKKIIMIPALVVTLGVGAAIGSTTLLSGSAQEKKILSMQEIEKKALAVVDGTVADIELDQNRYRSVYEVEVHADKEEYDLKFDAYTGKLLKQKKERQDDDDNEWVNANTATNLISKEKAIEAALTKTKGTVTKIKLDDGIYEIELKNGQYEYDVDVDSITGEIVDFEQDMED